MVAWMAAKSDPTDYGQIVSYEFPSGRNVDGPQQVFARINQDPRFSQERSLFDQSGSRVQFGDFLVIPIEDAMLYVEPVYIRSEQSNAIPELKRVIVVNGGRVGLGDTLQSALTDSFVGQVPSGGGGNQPTGTTQQQVAQLVQQALEHFDRANEALKAQDLGTYQRELNLAQQLLTSQERTGSGGGRPASSPSAAPSSPPPTVTATPTP